MSSWPMRTWFVKAHAPRREDTREARPRTTSRKVYGRVDAVGLVANAGAHLAVEVADRLWHRGAIAGDAAGGRRRDARLPAASCAISPSLLPVAAVSYLTWVCWAVRPEGAPRGADAEGYRHAAPITGQYDTDIAVVKLCRRRTHLEQSILTGKDAGMPNTPFGSLAHGLAWPGDQVDPP